MKTFLKFFCALKHMLAILALLIVAIFVLVVLRDGVEESFEDEATPEEPAKVPEEPAEEPANVPEAPAPDEPSLTPVTLMPSLVPAPAPIYTPSPAMSFAPKPLTMLPPRPISSTLPPRKPTKPAPKPTTQAPKPTTQAPKPTTQAPKPTTQAAPVLTPRPQATNDILPITWPLSKGAPWYVSKGGKSGISAKDGALVYQMRRNVVGSKSGAMFYANPHKLLPADKITMAYSAYIPQEYDWKQKGGKLPGVCLGTASGACATGGEWKQNEGSFRVMFRENNAAIGYAYPAFSSGNVAMSKQGAAMKSVSATKGDAGIDMWHGKNSGDFQLVSGQWNAVSFSITLNTPGQANGTLTMTVNGKTKSLDGVAWRDSGDVKINNVLMVAFFGGSDEKEWAQAKDMAFQFKDVRVTR